MFFVLSTALPDCSNVSQSARTSCPHLQDWHLASLTPDSWVGGGGSGTPSQRLRVPTLPQQGSGEGKLNRKQGQEGVGSPSADLPLPGNNFAILAPPFPVTGSSSGPIRNRMWVGGDFPMVGAPAPSPGRYKAASPGQRNLDGKERGHHDLLEPRGKPEVGPHPATHGQGLDTRQCMDIPSDPLNSQGKTEASWLGQTNTQALTRTGLLPYTHSPADVPGKE